MEFVDATVGTSGFTTSDTLLVLELESGTDSAMRTTPDGRLDGPIYSR
jgi:hypothetical protein